MALAEGPRPPSRRTGAFRPARLAPERLEDRALLDAGLQASFVSGLYHDLLHRLPARAELALWTTQPNAGLSPAQAAATLTGSAEYDLVEIDAVYGQLLGRAPGAGDVGAWLPALQGGTTLEEFTARVLASDEFYADSGGTPDGWLDAVYRAELGRGVDSAALEAWGKAGNVATSRLAIAQTVIGSAEAEALTVANVYEQLLHRLPDRAGAAAWQSALANGLTEAQLVAALAASAEYQAIQPAASLSGVLLQAPASLAASATVTVQVPSGDGFAAGAAVAIDVDLNHTGKFDAPGDAGFGTGTLGAGGSATVTLPPLPDGSYAVRARVTGADGTDQLSNVVTLTVGTAAGALPLGFEANAGQTDSQVNFLAHGRGFTVFLTPTQMTTTLLMPGGQEAGFTFQLVGSSPSAQGAGLGLLAARSNYFVGSDPAQWQTNIKNYAGVEYHNVYQGIDLDYRGPQGQLEYDFVVNPGATPGAIRWQVPGAGLALDSTGALLVTLPGGSTPVSFAAPHLYQVGANGVRQDVSGGYVLEGGGLVGFQVGAYDPTRPLVIDPSVSFATFLGGSTLDNAHGIAADAAGNSYVVGSTTSTNFPTSAGAFQTANNGNSNAFVTKLNAGGAIAYSTYLGGGTNTANTDGNGIAVDAGGNAYVAGDTGSGSFPTTAGAFQTTNKGGSDAFVTKLNAAGNGLIYSTYVGGSQDDSAHGVAVDAAGNAYITGPAASTNFPITAGVVQSSSGGFANSDFVTKLNATGTALLYSTYVAGVNNENVTNAIAVGLDGSAYVTGDTTNFASFPATPGAFQTYGTATTTGGREAFILKLNPRATAYSYATLLAGSADDVGLGIAVDCNGNAFVTGTTHSTNFPTTPGAFQTTFRDTSSNKIEAFVTEMNAAGSAPVYSTYLGGTGNPDGGEEGHAIAVDGADNAYVTGSTGSNDFPTNGATQSYSGAGDAFVTVLNPTGSGALFSTYLGGSKGSESGNGIALDAANNIHVAGETRSSDFPVTAGAAQTTFGGSTNDAFAAQFAAVSNAGACVPINSFSLDLGTEVTPLVRAFFPFRYLFNNVLDTYRGNLTLITRQPAPLQGQVSFVFPSLPPGVTVANATGTLPGGTPFITVSGSAGIFPEAPFRARIEFSDPLGLPLSTFYEGFPVRVFVK